MPQNYKRVPAIDKCFSILSLIAESKRPFGYNEIVKNLGLNKSTVFNILYTLNDLGVLERGPSGLFRLGPRLFILGNAAAGGSELIQTVHPYLESINNDLNCLHFLGFFQTRKSLSWIRRSGRTGQDIIRNRHENSYICRSCRKSPSFATV